ncbi:hypothetical protein O6H91_05G000200 [Diphasiastrum complanatum]|uniref:Uncharacterized protein n=1 Tax=Diphasiastrum complanatum TaxID=34168 RepID=A0ACC2DJV8_DIPCM|nr:hypothetical protein O6H91_05G000200 [Diphasiastrum complanatum]
MQVKARLRSQRRNPYYNRHCIQRQKIVCESEERTNTKQEKASATLLGASHLFHFQFVFNPTETRRRKGDEADLPGAFHSNFFAGSLLQTAYILLLLICWLIYSIVFILWIIVCGL